MKQGVLINHRTRLLLDGRTTGYHPVKHGERRRKSVRGCIVGNDLAVINLVIVKRGPTDLPKLTDPASDRPSTRGPKRANKIRKVWGLTKADDVRRYVVRRKIPAKAEGKKDTFKSPKIQRLVTPITRQRKRRRIALKRRRHQKATTEAAEYQKLITSLRKERKTSVLQKKREVRASEVRKSVADVKPATKTPVTTKATAGTTKTTPGAKVATTKTATTKTTTATKTAKKPVAKKTAPKTTTN